MDEKQRQIREFIDSIDPDKTMKGIVITYDEYDKNMVVSGGFLLRDPKELPIVIAEVMCNHGKIGQHLFNGFMEFLLKALDDESLTNLIAEIKNMKNNERNFKARNFN